MVCNADVAAIQCFPSLVQGRLHRSRNGENYWEALKMEVDPGCMCEQIHFVPEHHFSKFNSSKILLCRIVGARMVMAINSTQF